MAVGGLYVAFYFISSRNCTVHSVREVEVAGQVTHSDANEDAKEKWNGQDGGFMDSEFMGCRILLFREAKRARLRYVEKRG